MGATPGEHPAETSDRYGMLFAAARDGVWISDADGSLVRANPALLDLLGYTREECLALDEGALFADGKDWAKVRERVVRDGHVRDVELRMLRRDGREVVCLVRAFVERDADGAVVGHQGVVHDITHLKHAEERRLHESFHDSLTHLPNRAAFRSRVERLLARMAFQAGTAFAVLFVDIDRFKRINASLGHRAGDELLVSVSHRLCELVRPDDVVARLGGDEFALLLLQVTTVEEAEVVARRVQAGLERPFYVRGSEVYVSASLGIVLGDRRYQAAEQVVADGHTVMHAAKGEGPAGRAVFQGAMRERAAQLLAMETALRRGLEREEFVLHYQPLISMATGALLGFEALVRWQHPARGLLPPSEFLDVAEETGLIVPLGDWVLEEACRAAVAWRAEAGVTGDGPDDGAPVMAVNLSGRQLLTSGLADRVEGVLRATGLPGAALRLEITESVFLKRSENLLATLDALAGLGVMLCLDDFGTVYSTLAYLAELPVHTLKIDRSFIGQIGHGTGSDMVETILALARRLGLRAVAEGVETEEQRDDLLRLGCDDAQGFLFSAPVDAGRALTMVRNARVRVRLTS